MAKLMRNASPPVISNPCPVAYLDVQRFSQVGAFLVLVRLLGGKADGHVPPAQALEYFVGGQFDLRKRLFDEHGGYAVIAEGTLEGSVLGDFPGKFFALGIELEAPDFEVLQHGHFLLGCADLQA
jgi:hypothetical protein